MEFISILGNSANMDLISQAKGVPLAPTPTLETNKRSLTPYQGTTHLNYLKLHVQCVEVTVQKQDRIWLLYSRDLSKFGHCKNFSLL